jgi:heme A synthase
VIAIAFLLAVIVFGAMVVLRGLEPGLAALDLGSALTVLALMLLATVVAFARYGNPGLPDRLSFQSSFVKLALWTLVTVFIVLVSGVLVAASGSVVRCLGWPLYSGQLALSDLRGWLQLARRLLAGLASILVIAVVVQAWRRQPGGGAIRRTATMMGVLFVTEIAVGAFLLVQEPPIVLQVVYSAIAAAFWTLLVVLVVLAGLVSPVSTEEFSEAK